MKRVAAILAFAAIGAAAPLAWTLAESPGAGAVRVVDDAGTTVALPAAARRIVSLAPHATELLYAAGAGERIVAVVAGSDYPEAAKRLPTIGDVQAIDLERIVALKPDLVVTWPWTTPTQVAKLRGQGIAIFVSDAKTIDGIASDVERLGVLAGTEPVARAAADAMRAKIVALRAGRTGLPRLTVFYEIWDSPLFTIGGSHLITQAIALCGGENVFASQSIPAPQIGVEAVLGARPDVILAGSDGGRRPDWLDAWRRWPTLPAVAFDRLYVVDADKLHRPGPRFVDGVAEVCAALDDARGRRTPVAADQAGTNVRPRPSPSERSGRPNNADSRASVSN